MRIRFLAALMSVGLVLPAAADDTVLYKTVSGWTVAMDPSMGYGCYIYTPYQDGTQLRLGFDFRENPTSVFLAIGHANWQSLEAGKDYDIQIQFDRNPLWNATARALEMNGVKYFVVTSTSSNFVMEFSRKLTVRALYAGREVARLRLSGSSRAISEMLNCQEATKAALGANAKPKDPFAAPPATTEKAKDPFAL